MVHYWTIASLLLHYCFTIPSLYHHCTTTDKQKGADEATSLSMPDFFVHSYLSYGVDKAKERLWDTLLAKSTEDSTDDHISNPCDFVVREGANPKQPTLGSQP